MEYIEPNPFFSRLMRRVNNEQRKNHNKIMQISSIL